MKENNIKQYLNKLRKIISKELPKDECNNVMEYYEEYFADAGFETEADIVNELGNVETLAGRIIQEHREKNQNQGIDDTENEGFLSGKGLFLTIIAWPLWLVLFCLGLAGVITLFSLTVSFGAVSVGLILGGIGTFIGGVVLLFSDVIIAIYVLGCAFILCSIGLLFVIITKLIVGLTLKFLGLLKGKKNKKKSDVIFK